MRQLEMRYEGGPIVAPSPPDGLVIRNYEDADREGLLDALMPLTQKRYTIAELDENILKHVGVTRDCVFVAELCGRIVGTATGWTHDTGGTLHMVSELGEVSGMGIGCAVCASVVNRLLEKGCRYVDLTTDDFRLSAITVYTRLGFRPVIRDEDALERWRDAYARLGLMAILEEAYT